MAFFSTSTLLMAGVAMAAVGAVASGVAEKKRSDFEAADLTQRAFREQQIAGMDEEDFRRRQSKIASDNRAAQGRSNVLGTTGSPLLAAADFDAETELQAQRIRAGGATRSSRLVDQSRLTASAGKSAQTRGFFKAGSSLLSGAGKIYA